MEIMYDDLTYEAQQKLLAEAGVDTPEEMGWDSVPVAVVNFEQDEDEEEDYEDEDLMEDEDFDFD